MEVSAEIPMPPSVGPSEFQFAENTKSSLKLRSLYALQF